MTEKNNQRDNNNIEQNINKTNKDLGNNNTNHRKEILNIKPKYEITTNDEGDIGNPVSGDNPKNQHTSGSDDGDHNEKCKHKRFEVSDLSGPRSGDQYEEQRKFEVSMEMTEKTSRKKASKISQKERGYKASNPSGSRSGDQSEEEVKPKVGWEKNKLSGSRGGDLNEGHGKSNERNSEYGVSNTSGFRSGDHREGRIKDGQRSSGYGETDHETKHRSDLSINKHEEPPFLRCQEQSEKQGSIGEYEMTFPALSSKEIVQTTEEKIKEDGKEEQKWQISKERIGYTEEKHWSSHNVQLNTIMGRNWLRRITEEGIIIRDYFRLSTGGKEEISIDQDKTVKIIEDAAKKGGTELKIIRGEDSRQEEMTMNIGMDDSMKLTYFQESNTIKIKRKTTPIGAGKIR